MPKAGNRGPKPAEDSFESEFNSALTKRSISKKIKIKETLQL